MNRVRLALANIVAFQLFIFIFISIYTRYARSGFLGKALKL